MTTARLLVVSALLALCLSATVPDLSALGPLAIETISFPGLTDAARNVSPWQRRSGRGAGEVMGSDLGL